MTSAVDVTDFEEYARNIGEEDEDWQPAFQEAIDTAQREHKAVYVPAGEYKIRTAISIVPAGDRSDRLKQVIARRQGLRICGDGPYLSIISQEVETENCVNWTGLKYKEGANNGHLSDICLRGGATTLNIKWHNYFTLDSCYIVGAHDNGIHTEGWSSRFLNSIIEYCQGACIWASDHFNNCVIRDCYFSHAGVGVRFCGVHGSRIEGCGFEICAKAAVLLNKIKGLTINNSYFEGNGNKQLEGFPVSGSANTIHFDHHCWQVNIHDCILRANLDDQGALISVADCLGGHIYDNLLYTVTPGRCCNALKLRAGSETCPEEETAIANLRVENNLVHNCAQLLVEEQPGLVEQAVANGSSFDWELSETN